MEIIKVVFTSLFSALALFIIAKIIGHKQMSELDFFDYITGITIGSIAAEMATEIEEPTKPLVAMVVYGAITFLLSLITQNMMRSRKYINGTPTIIMNDQKIYRKNLKKAKLEISEFLMMCRQQGYFDLSDIQTAVFEYNGNLSILPKSDKRPVTAYDLSLNVKKDHVKTEVIIDGRILDENLHRRGLDTKWLTKELKNQGYKSAKEVLLAICDEQNILTIYDI